MDMATGTADVAIMLSKELATLDATTAPHTVIGIDPSAKMLDVSTSKIFTQHARGPLPNWENIGMRLKCPSG